MVIKNIVGCEMEQKPSLPYKIKFKINLKYRKLFEINTY